MGAFRSGNTVPQRPLRGSTHSAAEGPEPPCLARPPRRKWVCTVAPAPPPAHPAAWRQAPVSPTCVNIYWDDQAARLEVASPSQNKQEDEPASSQKLSVRAGGLGLLEEAPLWPLTPGCRVGRGWGCLQRRTCLPGDGCWGSVRGPGGP